MALSFMILMLFKGFLDLHGLELRDFKDILRASWIFMALSFMIFKGFLELLSLELHEFKAIYGLLGTS